MALPCRANLTFAHHLMAKSHRSVTVCNRRTLRLADSGSLFDSRGMSVPSNTLLIVEDDPEISRLVRAFMQNEGFEVEVAADAKAMDAVLGRLRPDLIILDLMLPGEDGISICRRLRAADSIPILMLTAKNDDIDRVLGLEMGADDYVVKPFGPRELLARVRAILRRTQGAPPQPNSRRFGFDRFIIDLDARRLDSDGLDRGAIALTSAEFDLLACFVQRPRRVLTRDQILDWTRGRSAEPFDRTVDMLISRLRKKLDARHPGSNLITTVRNGGYLFTAEVRRVS